MNVRRSLPRVSLIPLLVAAVLTALLVTVSASPAFSKVRPQDDHATMPRKCVKPKDLIPAQPTICELNTFKDTRPTVVLWGDSHAWMMIPALRRATGNKNVNLVAIVLGGCPPMDNQIQPDDQAPSCFKSNDMAIRYVRELKSQGQGMRVILAGSWQRYLHAIKAHDKTYTGTMAREMRTGTPRLMRTLAGIGLGVDVIGQVATVPEKKADCRAGNLPYSCNLPIRKAMPEKKSTRQWLVKTIRPLAGNRAPIDVTPFFCTSKVCHGKVGRTHTWWDDLHLSASMSQRLRGYLKPSVEKAIADRPTEPATSPSGGCTIPILGIPC
ncbi:hypothetical protein BH11ACT8_BH11ACT8_09000 [soil metagenome]